ncbi:MAG: leucine-rich repeat domain-containing protein, partial [Clostridiales bacterium]|nr:leucine-rich repeat domain-containing protein [Clostridiales bacterium]
MEEVDLSRATYLGYGSLAATKALKTVNLEKVGFVGDYAFSEGGLQSVTIPANTRVGEAAFSRCDDLEEVIIESDFIGDLAFVRCPSLESVTFKNHVRKIGANAFAYCDKLASVTFESTVYEIGNYAFADCPELASFKVPAGLARIGTQILANSGVTEIVISKDATLAEVTGAPFYEMRGVSAFVVEDGSEHFSVENGVLYNKDKTKLIAYPFAKAGTTYSAPAGLKTIGTGAFYGAYRLSTFDLGNSVERIEDYAFSNIRSTNLTLTGFDSVKYIGEAAFFASHVVYYDENRNEVEDESEAVYMRTVLDYHTLNALPFGNQIEHIGVMALATCNYTNGVLVLPNSLTYLGDDAFAYNSTVTSVTFGNKLQTVGDGVFENNSALKSINLGSLTQISNGMFTCCTALERVVIPNTVQKIGDGAFLMIDENENILENKLTEVVLPEGLTEIPSFAFAGAKLASVSLPVTVTKIGYGAFGYTDLTSIDLKNVTEIGGAAFAGCKLKNVGSEKVTKIGNDAFAETTLLSANFPNAVEVGDSAFDSCTSLSNVELSRVKTVGARAFYGCINLATAYLDSATEIGSEAFSGCKTLEEVSLNNAKSIGAYAFKETMLTKIELYASLETVDELAFRGAKYLQEIVVESENEKFLTEDGVLYMKNARNYFTLVCYPEGKEDEEYTAKSRTLKVGAYAFSGNDYVKKVTLPVHVQIIGASAFANMKGLEELNLKSVYAPRLESYLTGSGTSAVHVYNNFKV